MPVLITCRLKPRLGRDVALCKPSRCFSFPNDTLIVAILNSDTLKKKIGDAVNC